ncbi:hypothetical protein KC960_05330, partial [Candidatus Saccharibacteria bacterium]|nr:hypothetical protein [Candidatus Saccharibacteria bacterium]
MKNLLTTIKLTLLATFFASTFIYAPINVQAQGLKPPEPTTSQVKDGDLKNNPIIKWIEFFINVLSVTILAGGSVMIAWAGIQYMTARDNAQNVQAAKEKIWNVIIGLLAYFFLYA